MGDISDSEHIDSEGAKNSNNQGKMKKPSKRHAKPGASAKSYVNVHRTTTSYRDKYKKDVDKAVAEYSTRLGKSKDEFTNDEWRQFYKTVLIPLDKNSERQMIDLFIGNRDELNQLLILHNTKASDNIAEVAYKKYEKNTPTKWHDLEDFRQMALEGLSIAAQRFDIDSGNKFITYATWWMLNKVLHPSSEKGAKNRYSYLDAPVRGSASAMEGEDATSLGDIFGSATISPDYDASMMDNDGKNPTSILNSRNIEENINLISEIKRIPQEMIGKSIDGNKAVNLTKYLMSVVEDNSDSTSNRQIFLYIFKKIFSKCSSFFKDGSQERETLKSYVNDAAETKVDLLKRIGMDEKTYKHVCDGLMKRCYNGL